MEKLDLGQNSELFLFLHTTFLWDKKFICSVANHLLPIGFREITFVSETP